MSPRTAEHMIWHPAHGVVDGVMVHPSDGEAWKRFNSVHLNFSAETDKFGRYFHDSPTDFLTELFRRYFNLPMNLQTDIFNRYFNISPTHLPTVTVHR